MVQWLGLLHTQKIVSSILTARKEFSRMLPNGSEISRILSNGSEISRILSNAPECSRMLPNAPECSSSEMDNNSWRLAFVVQRQVGQWISKKASAIVRDSIGVSISTCHADDPGSIPGLGGGQQSSPLDHKNSVQNVPECSESFRSRDRLTSAR